MNPRNSISGRMALAALLPLLGGCWAPMVLSPNDAPTVLAEQRIDDPGPHLPGDRAVETFTYGSGTDRHRPEYRDVAIRTDSVDASKLVDLGESEEERNELWGFSPEGFPLNGRVWHPGGEGPFPLVLVVHGNHDPEDYSDPGYDWLGELLASRGYIVASIDMNFINGGIRGENDARGWLLLKHLEAWHAFARDPASPVHGQVDTTRIALIGHSRGGEAVAHAAAFNRLDRYPDDATLEFDFGYDIRSLVAIAPVDGQYLPTDRAVPLEDVSYLVLHGSHDGDVTSFHGLRQWNRLDFPGGGERFKAAVYMYRANHGQWNTVWGNLDNGPRSARRLDLRSLVPPEDQRRAGEIYISAFLDRTLKGIDRWDPLFRDHRVVGEWLPKTMYVTQLEHASFVPLADFEEDIDVTTGARAGVTLSAEGFDTWREGTLPLRSRNRANTSASQENQALRLGWKGDAKEGSEGSAAFELTLSSEAAAALATTPEHSLDLQLVVTRTKGGDDTEGAESTEAEADATAPTPVLEPVVEIEDEAGRTARVSLADYGPVREPFEIRILRRRDQEAGMDSTESVLQSFHLPLADFEGIDPARIRAVRLVFERTPGAEVAVDNIGVSRMGASWWRARVGG